MQEWYRSIDSLDRGRITWGLPPDATLDPRPARASRSSTELFDAVPAALPTR